MAGSDSASSRASAARWARLVAVAIVLATLANGANYFLKRVGVVDPEGYARFTRTFCESGGGGLRNDCMCMRELPAEVLAALPVEEYPGLYQSQHSVFRDEGPARALKLLKDALFLGFAAPSLWLLFGRGRVESARPALPAVALLASVGLGFAWSYWQWGIVFAVAGLRSFGFLAVALVGGWFAPHLSVAARAVGLLLLIELLLVPIEYLWGMPLRPCPHSFRVAASMILPNSLGVMAVIGLAFFDAFAPSHLSRARVGAIGALLIIAAGSGVGLLALLGWGATRLLMASASQHRLVSIAGLLLLSVPLLWLLPDLTQRPDIYDSIFAPDGRIDKLATVVAQSGPTELLFGHGLGYGANVAHTLPRVVDVSAATLAPWSTLYTDSTLTWMLLQLGLSGVLLFYALIATAFQRDRAARPLYVVIVLTSLTMSLAELFPVNLLIGLALARSLAMARPVAAGKA
jgi:hypothetical protein